MQIDQIQNAEQFEEFMRDIWDGSSESAQDGGLICFQHPDYDTYHDALFTVRMTGARRTGGTKLGGEDAHVYRWPNNSGGIIIARNGAACQLTRHRFSKKS